MENIEVDYIISRLSYFSGKMPNLVSEYKCNVAKTYFPTVFIAIPIVYFSPKICSILGKYYGFFVLLILTAILLPILYHFFQNTKITKTSIRCLDQKLQSYTIKASSHIEVGDIDFNKKEELENSLFEAEILRRETKDKRSKLESVVIFSFIFNSAVSLLLSVSANYIFEFLKSVSVGG